MTYSKLIEILINNKDVTLDSVHSFYWNQTNHSVKNVSEEVRKKLAKDLHEAL